jgi:two-component system response regulator GlrR
LLIDEIGELPVRLQVELMKALREAPGGLSPLRSDTRLICTTSHDLKERLQTGEFRQDLFYHINILPIEIPPLGRRREDIPLLVSHFLEQVTEGGNKKIYSPAAIELLKTTDWPGNVRQLFDLVKQNVALSHGKIMSREFVERSLGKDVKKVPTYDEARDNLCPRLLDPKSSNHGRQRQPIRASRQTQPHRLLQTVGSLPIGARRLQERRRRWRQKGSGSSA